MEGTYAKKVDILSRKVTSSHAKYVYTWHLLYTHVPRLDMQRSYKSLNKRRDHEIEGFTNDIMLLRKQVQVLEHHLLQYGPLEDRELLLLQLGTPMVMLPFPCIH